MGSNSSLEILLTETVEVKREVRGAADDMKGHVKIFEGGSEGDANKIAEKNLSEEWVCW